MADWQTDARNAARRYGLGDWFVRQMGQEAHGADLTSPAGAQGPAQFMPGTARGVGLNSTTVHQRVPSYNAAAKLMAGYVHQYGSVQNALVAYNAGPGRVGHALPAETRGYISTILGGSNPPATSSPSSGTDAASGSTPGVSLPTPGAQPDLGQASDFTGLLSALLSKPQPQAVASSQPMQAPSFSAGPPLPQGFRGLLSAAPQAAQGPSVDDALGLISALGGQAGPSVQSSSGATGSVSATGSPSSPSKAPGGSQTPTGQVTVAAGANRPGTKINPAVLDFTSQVAGLYGHPLTIGTGTNHSKLTINGTVSDHYSGNGADVPLTGNALVKAGQDALIAAGMPAAKARKQTGGGYNVGGWQIIFNTDAPGWGDHTTHLHIGRRTR